MANVDIKAIFSEALEKPAHKRAEFLEEACADSPELKVRVEALLAALTNAGGFLEDSPIVEESAESPETSAATVSKHDKTLVERPGTIIGPYKLLQEIGHGGMGSVFMAEQEKPVRRKVALKVIKPGMDTRLVVARFEAERQALAIMDHPNIAKVFDAGATDAGRPYFVMELVKGVPITQYCDENQLTPKERLELFIPVCQAIQHAHQKGIIHRDIKPSNVLVTLHDGNPVPKVIDFGVAKAIDQRLTEKTMFTEFGQVIGTLEYMSPEQAELGALDIDTRSDVYSLGVLLYELLTGSTPLEKAKLRKAAYSEVLRRIREEEPTKPSTRLSESKDALPSISAQRKMEPARLTKLVRGDLDWIVMKSLEKDRTRRYETANGFAKDIQRYLEGDPVEACPPSAGYKIKKFARKHRTALATIGAFASLLVLATVVSCGLALWANQERIRALKAEKAAGEQKTRAEDREQMAIDAVKRFGDVIRETPELKNNPSLAPLRTILLKEPQEFFKGLRDRLQVDKDTTPQSLNRLAMASFELGKITSEIGDKQDAMKSFKQSLEIWKVLARENLKESGYVANLASIQYNIAQIQNETGRTTEALASLELARGIYERLTQEHPTVASYQSKLAGSLSSIGIILRRTGRTAEARSSYQNALRIYERLANEDPSNFSIQLQLAGVHNNIGSLENDVGRPAKALESFEQVRSILEPLESQNLRNSDLRSKVALSYFNIGKSLSDQGKTARALEFYEKALGIRNQLAHENPSVSDFQSDLAKCHNNIGFLHAKDDRLNDSLEAHKKARDIRERLARDNGSVAEFQSDLAMSISNIANVQNRLGRIKEAMDSYEKALAIQERLVRENRSVVQFQRLLAMTHYSIGVLQAKMGRPKEALESYTKARSIREELAKKNPSVVDVQCDLAESHQDIGLFQTTNGQPTEGLASFEQARAIFERLGGEDSSKTSVLTGLAQSHSHIGNVQSSSGRLEEALASHQTALRIRERLARENATGTDFQRDLARSCQSVGLLQSKLGRPDDAAAAHERARVIREQLAREHPDSPIFANELGASLNNLALVDLNRKRFEPAMVKLEEAIGWQRKALEKNPANPTYRQHLTNHLRNLILAAKGLGLNEKIAKAQHELKELRDSDPQIVALDARLTAVLEKKDTPKDELERIRFAIRASQKGLYSASARLYAEAFANDPKLADERKPPRRYNAACAAAIAGSGRGKDIPPSDDEAKARLRGQALEWLEAELASWTKLINAGAAEHLVDAANALDQWKSDNQLSCIRDERELEKLPRDERAAFETLWAKVDALLMRTRKP